MLSSFYSFHDFAEYFKIMAFGRKLQMIFPKKRQNNILEMLPVGNFKSKTLLVILAGVFLEIDFTAFKMLFKSIKNWFVACYKFYIEPWLDMHSANFVRNPTGIPNVGSKTSFPVD